MTDTKNKPLFISFEGGEGAGKGTQIKMLRHFLDCLSIPYISTREPGGTSTGEDLRALLLRERDDGDNWDAMSELLLMSASRRQLLTKRILPALAQEKWVICDRFADSTTVYQGEGRGLKQSDVKNINDMVVGDNWPDMTFIIDIDPQIGVARSLKNVQADGQLNQETRFENLKMDFHQRVRAGFLKVARKNQNRCFVIDGDNTPEAIHHQIISILMSFKAWL